MAVELMNPCAVFEERPSPLAPRLASLGPDTTVGLFANDKKNADVLLGNVESLLRERHGVTSFRWFRKEASSPARFTEEFIAECDVVAAAIAD